MAPYHVVSLHAVSRHPFQPLPAKLTAAGTDTEKQVFEKQVLWNCMQMERKYRQDMNLVDSSLTRVELATETFVPP
jgi:hypothetical protein